jgi:methyltransferase family protein
MSDRVTRLTLRKAVAALPILGPIAKRIYTTAITRGQSNLFRTSPEYWNNRYLSGGNSGAGSFGRLAVFKADVVNTFIAEQRIRTIVELGCGDGEQLKLSRYPRYTGIDVSPRAIEICRSRFAEDYTKAFYHMSAAEVHLIRADLSMSLDVVYHLIEDNIYHDYMSRLFAAGERFVAIYSSNCERAATAEHVRHRRFTDWIEQNAPNWQLMMTVPNQFPEDAKRPDDTSWADFYFFQLRQQKTINHRETSG